MQLVSYTNAPCIVYFQFITVIALFYFVPQYGMTACMWASVRGHTDVLQLFLSSGAQVDLQNEVRHNSGRLRQAPDVLYVIRKYAKILQ